MSTYNLVASTNQSTVVSEYTPETKKNNSYQSEAELEQEFIKLLTELGYEYVAIHTEEELISNLRKQLESLNNYTFTDNEWKRFFKNVISNQNEGIVEKTKKIQVCPKIDFTKDNGETKNIDLLDKTNIHNNKLQVINQYEENEGKHKTRYDVTILVNGLPLVHIELKRRGVSIKQAFNQIKRYQKDSFWASSGLFEYVQIFVISNGTHTKYYSNTTHESHLNEMKNHNVKNRNIGNTFEFTSFWADATNKIIPDLIDFTKTFFSKHTILNILTRYCVFTSENVLMVMRPYQIAACEKILNKIEIAHNYKYYGTRKAGGYIWHTTGSGKTLTSFKTAQLATDLPYIDKVLFVVDRKDLDYQTMKEYDRFEKGAANSSASTKVLESQLKGNEKIIITTIQKLSNFISKYKVHSAYQKNIVIIFDECHRSQFGEMHKAITKSFKNYYIFGFTGTPIFSENANTNGSVRFNTTADIFGGEPDEHGNETNPLHSYTIVDAINDGNVLPFRIDYIGNAKMKENTLDIQIKDIDREKALMSPKRIQSITSYILEHFNTKTFRNGESYLFKQLKNIEEVATAKDRNKVKEIKEKTRLVGFNSIFAVQSIDMAKAYYLELKKQMEERPELGLKIGLIYSFGVNEDMDYDILEEENPENTSGLDQSSRDFLDMAIKDYNEMFGTSFDTSPEKFQNYYKDVSLRMKNRELDMLIVVNMFLTGFDSKTLNTLWVDKNLKYHGLIQAFSRTNRILNSVKTFGNIVCFRNLEKRVNDAIALFADDDSASGIVLLRSYKEYYNGYKDNNGKYHKGYIELINQLLEDYPLGTAIIGETKQKDFIKLFSSILRMRNILNAFDDFANDTTISERDLQDYQSIYIDLYNDYSSKDKADKENINDDIEFEMELVKQVEVNIDYILTLIEEYHKSNCTNKEIKADINRAISSSPQLRSKKELIENFVNTINIQSNVSEDWKIFVEKQKQDDLKNIIEEEQLKPAETKKFIENSFRDGMIKTSGTDLDKLLPPMGLFGNAGVKRKMKKQTIIDKFFKFFEKYFGL